MIRRSGCLAALRSALARSPVVAILGPRQCGKTTLARQFAAPGAEHVLRPGEPGRPRRLAAPMTVLDPLPGLVVIDEVQRLPELFDAPPGPRRPTRRHGPLPSPRLRFAGPGPGGLRVPGRPHGIRRPRRVRSHGGRRGRARPILAARRASPSFLASDEPASLAWRTTSPDLSRTRCTAARDHDPRRDPAPLLDHGRALPRPVWNASESPARSGRKHGAPISTCWPARMCASCRPGSRTSASARSSRPRSTSATAASCTPC